ncbi:LysR family transcriptional regulator [Pigmentiphaga sp. H8]|uniref:LysR family transcriptional regulator n=1 Tax=Pigmentiphaga sp. H8 TaxID=2488560 RepID=UPI000F5B312C|nr:LysR family transcriptional regulator [Pigmentiphaga sp. H8]AZG08417.1 LysR family transcriptional regulator [Pigmentiphaga sp. H8]
MTIHIRPLDAFLAVAQYGTLGRAAQKLNITQPALSRTIRKLEEQIGMPLFERYLTGMKLTAAGETLLPRAALIQKEAEAATEEIDELRGLARGTIRVGAIASAVGQILPQAIAQVLEQWPRLQVHIVEGIADVLVDALVNREVDLTVGASMPASPDICAIPDCHWEDASYIVAAPSHPLRANSVITLADTLDYKWVLSPEGTAPYEDLSKEFAKAGLPMPEVIVKTRSNITNKSLISHGGFLGWLAEPLYEPERQAGWIDRLPVAGVVKRRQLQVYRRSHGLLPQPAVKLLDVLRQLTSRR